MPRKQAPLVNGEKYHLYNRGTDKRNIFKNKKDYLRFYESLYLFNTIEPVKYFIHARKVYDPDSAKLVNIHAYSLLPNHFHMIVEQLSENGISEFMKRVAGGYTSYFNQQYDRNGVLFQGKFKRVLIGNDEQYKYMFAYVNENHFVHNVTQPQDIIYSSSNHYQHKAKSRLIQNDYTYSSYEAKSLAKEIYRKRSASKLRLE